MQNQSDFSGWLHQKWSFTPIKRASFNTKLLLLFTFQSIMLLSFQY